MSNRARHSTAARQSTAGPAASGSETIPLPPYQPPENPLNIQGQRVLHSILQSHNHRKLEDHIRQAAEALGDNAGFINERLSDRKEQDLVRRKKHAGALTPVDERRARHLEDYDARVTAMTGRMEEAMRKTIDAQHYAGILQDELESIERQAVENASASQRITQTQRRHGDDDDEMTDYDPTLPGESQHNVQHVEVIVPKNIYEQRVQAQKDDYRALSRPTRYSEHPHYKGFKQAVHGGVFRNGGPPLAHASTWFTSSGAPAPGVTQAGGDESDDDVAIAFERISTKCPLTLQELKDPLTSTKCPHTFEKTAILELIRRSNAFAGGSTARGARDGQRTVQCPVGGCDKMLTQQDLQRDEPLIRKIRRIQRRREEMDEESDDERLDDSRAQVIPSDDADGFEDVDLPASQRIVPKMERSSGAIRDPGVGGSGTSGTGYDGAMESTIVDLGSGSEEE